MAGLIDATVPSTSDQVFPRPSIQPLALLASWRYISKWILPRLDPKSFGALGVVAVELRMGSSPPRSSA